MRIPLVHRALALALGLSACDSGSEVAVVDWSKLEARVTQLGKTVAFIEGRLTRDGTLLATATTNARLVEAGKALQ